MQTKRYTMHTTHINSRSTALCCRNLQSTLRGAYKLSNSDDALMTNLRPHPKLLVRYG